MYVHFAVNTIAFNGDEKSEEQVKKTKRQIRCQIYRRNYVDEIKKRKQQEIYNPELNKIVLLKNVPVQESEQEIKETLEEYGYSIKTQHHFKQCRNCYKLNHIAKECPQKRKICKHCGLKNHEASKYRHKNDPSRHRCVLCKKGHPSDSVQYEIDEISSLKREITTLVQSWELETDQEMKTLIIISSIFMFVIGVRQEDLECYVEEIYIPFHDHLILCLIHLMYLIEICNASSLTFKHLSKKLHHAMKISEHIIIGGDWNAHHPAWLDHNTDDVGDCILDFIVSNGLNIINTLPFNCTQHQALILHYAHHIFFHLLAIGEQMMLNWMCIADIDRLCRRSISKPRGHHHELNNKRLRLRSNKWEQFRLRLKNIDNWMQSITPEQEDIPKDAIDIAAFQFEGM
ncbi:hypothetical protein RFI_26606 [Reticulomyxa filosa]|uniref:Endonuclease/exonuclease/phosphatase domain-containing protein n=1 Tax=Reticulomyxa filosa TaxID=46433 RepID=X6MAU3_RETFI|nr:hypothetical protein RFI_26606 [Reticulomyxa filosa]|eukprot:ETO10771.1 hypothetical protein RFI_26606 [Reticulomyxa filosa]